MQWRFQDNLSGMSCLPTGMILWIDSFGGSSRTEAIDLICLENSPLTWQYSMYLPSLSCHHVEWIRCSFLAQSCWHIASRIELIVQWRREMRILPYCQCISYRFAVTLPNRCLNPSYESTAAIRASVRPEMAPTTSECQSSNDLLKGLSSATSRANKKSNRYKPPSQG